MVLWDESPFESYYLNLDLAGVGQPPSRPGLQGDTQVPLVRNMGCTGPD